jgi:hypothetical protein
MAHFFILFSHWISHPYWIFVKRDNLLSKKIKFKYENIKLKKNSSGSCLTSKLHDKIIKMPSKPHETIPLSTTQWIGYQHYLQREYGVDIELNVCEIVGNSEKRFLRGKGWIMERQPWIMKRKGWIM